MRPHRVTSFFFLSTVFACTFEKVHWNVAGTVGIADVLALLFLFPILSSVITSPGWHRHLEQLSPMTAGLYIQATTNLRSLPLTPWQGLGVLATWAAGAMLAGALVLRFRDA